MNKKAENTIIDYLRKWSIETPYKIAYTFFSYLKNERNEVHVTCRQIYEESQNYAKYFSELGLKKGDRCIIFAEQTPETIYAMYGIMMAGGIFIFVPTPTDINKERRFITTLESSSAKYIIYRGEKQKIFDEIEGQYINVYDIERRYDKEWVYNVNIDDVACLQYTSGSVNAPKGIMTTHRNIIAAMKCIEEGLPQNMDDINVSWLPFFHTMGLIMGIFYNTYVNRRDIIMSLEVFQEKPLRWLKAISNYKATHIIAPNSAYMSCIRMISEEEKMKLDFSKLRYVINGSEIIQKSNWSALSEEFRCCGLNEYSLYPAYGLTECTCLATVGSGNIQYIEADWDELKKNRIVINDSKELTRTMASVGKCIKGIKIVIVNIENNTECNKNEIGEIWVQGETVAQGYWNNEEATKEVFYATLPNHKGRFLRTGDLGAFVGDDLYITGRIKEMMVVNGKNIYAKDIELYIKQEIIQLRTKVLYAFTVPVRKKERVIIGIEYRDNKKQLACLVKQINAIMYKYFNLEAYDIFFVNDKGLPRTDNGKLALMKIYHAYVGKKIEFIFSLRKYEKEKPVSEFTSMQLEIKDIFEQILGGKCKSNNDSFLDLGGTSLEIFSLIMQLKKKFNVAINLKEIVKDSTIKGIEQNIINKINAK